MSEAGAVSTENHSGLFALGAAFAAAGVVVGGAASRPGVASKEPDEQ